MERKTVLKPEFEQLILTAFTKGRALLLSAPCGFGKTCAARMLFSGAGVLFLSADEPDFSLLRTNDSWDTLIIDDFQCITSSHEQERICSLIRDNTDKRFAFLSRSMTPSWLIPFQIAGVLTVLDSEAMAFDRETVALLFSEYGVKLSQSELTAILRDTKGYPLAVDLLARRMARGEPYCVGTYDQVRRDIYIYFEEAVYRRFELSTRRLTLELAPFEPFDTELARILSGDSDAGEKLARWQRNTTMIIQERMGCYRFWPTFRSFLQWELEQEYSEEQQKMLYNRAGLYYELKSDYGKALECYSRSGDYGKTSELLVKNAEMHPGLGHYCEMEPYYRALPEDTILASPPLMQAMSMLCAICMDYEGSERWYRSLLDFTQGKKRSDAAARDARGRLAWLDISLPQRSVDSAIELFPKVFNLLRSRDISLPAFSVTSTLPSLMNGGKDFSNWSKRDDMLYAMLRMPVSIVLGRDGVCMPECSIAESKFEKGEDIRDRAMYLLRNLDRIRRDGTPDIEFAVVGLLARMHLAQGRPADARQSLLELRERFEADGDRRFIPNINAMLCRVSLYMGDDVEVDRWYLEEAPKNPQHIQGMKRYQYFTQALAELALGDENSVLLTIAPLEPYFKACARHIDTIHLHVITALALKRIRDSNWSSELSMALDIASDYGFIRTIGEYGAAVLPLLENCGWKGDESFLQKLMSYTREQASIYPDYLQPHPDLSAPLSATETQVLRLLCANKSNAEIGEILNIKLATVKTHVSHILYKLGLKRRSEVRDAAIRLHLIR